MKNKNKVYQVEMTSKQLDVYRSAVEFYSRFLTGQIDSFPTELEDFLRENEVPGKWDPQRRTILGQLKRLMFPVLVEGITEDPVGASYGIGNSPIRETDIAYEMYREVYVLREKENPSEGHSVYKNSTHKVSAEPLTPIKDVTRESKLRSLIGDNKDDKFGPTDSI